MNRVLIIEDEEGLIITLSDRLSSEEFDVTVARDGIAGFEKAIENRFDVIILDLMLPKKNGFDVCRDLRKEGINTPILMLTARGETIDKVLGLKLGADDYLTKPFEIAELLARIESLLRRSGSGATGKNRFVEFGNVYVDFDRVEIKVENNLIELSAMEFKLLQFLVENRGKVHSRNVLLDEVWGYDAMPNTRTVDVHVAWLRQKLEGNPKHPRYILTVHGLGYKFVD